MKRSGLSANGSGISVFRSRRIILMSCTIQRFGYQCSLQCKIFRSTRAECFIDCPTNRTMVYNTMICTGHSQPVISSSSSQADPQKTTYWFTVNPYRSRPKTNSFARSGLPGYGYLFIRHYSGFQTNDAGNSKQYGTRPAPIRYRLTKATGTGIIQISNIDHLTATATTRITAIPFCTGEGQLTRHKTPYFSFRHSSVFFHFIYTPIVSIHTIKIRAVKSSIRLRSFVARRSLIRIRNQIQIRPQIHIM